MQSRRHTPPTWTPDLELELARTVELIYALADRDPDAVVRLMAVAEAALRSERARRRGEPERTNAE